MAPQAVVPSRTSTMYNDYFGFREAPFTIAPDPRYLYLSDSHREALAHLLFAVGGQGALTLVTGEVGTGKTTVCRRFIEQVPEHVDVALVLNPRVNGREMLASIAQELGLRFNPPASTREMTNALNRYLLAAHARGRHTVLIIDEAQNLTPEVLEQLRLLTNLETSEKKLLQIVLLGQPELQQLLSQKNLRQLNQRIGARYHLQPLGREDIQRYLAYRLQVAGRRDSLFTSGAIRRITRLSGGIPRLINLLADRSLLGAYARSQTVVDRRTVSQAAAEVLPRPGRAPRKDSPVPSGHFPWLPVLSVASAVGACVFVLWLLSSAGHLPGSLDVMALMAGKTLQEERLETVAAESVSATEHTPGAETPAGDREFLLNASARNSRDQADRALMGLWGHNYRPVQQDNVCEFALNRGLQCLNRNGNWRSLLQLDHPVILRLFNARGESVYAVLSELHQQEARVLVNGRERLVERDLLDEFWLGEYSLVWRQPPFESRLIEPGESRDRDSWLRQALDMAGISSQGGLSQQVMRFQRDQGLVPDGITGPVTLIRMNQVLEIPGPRLSGDGMAMTSGDGKGGEG